jgi:hypothetical protein
MTENPDHPGKPNGAARRLDARGPALASTPDKKGEGNITATQGFHTYTRSGDASLEQFCTSSRSIEPRALTTRTAARRTSKFT